MRVTVGLAAALMLVAACGGSGLPNGAKAKDTGDIQKICVGSWESVADAVGRKSSAGKLYIEASKPCCSEVVKEAKRLNKVQQTFLWYEYAAEDDLRRSQEEIDALLAVNDALRESLSREEQGEVFAARQVFGSCMSRIENR